MEWNFGHKVLLVGLAFLGAIVLQGCSEDTICPDPEAGVVHVLSEPDTLAVPWTLTLPDGLFAAGVSDTTLPSMIPGEYSVTWGMVEGWLRTDSNDSALVLEDQSAVTFQSVYVVDDSPTGTISIEPSPGYVDPGWVLSGPNGFITDGSHGAVVFEAMQEGDYTLDWGYVAGWESPDPDTVEQFLPDGGSLTFTGVYVEKAKGMIAVDVNPDSMGVLWHLDGPDDFAFDGSGDMTLANIMVGDYTVVWPTAENWVTPPTETLTVVADETVTFTGNYEVDLPFPANHDILMENFLYVYESMFYEGYISLLDEGHRTLVLPSTVDEWEGSENPLVFPYFDYSAAIAIHDNLFHGLSGVGPSGLAIPPIDSISVDVFERMGPWEVVPQSVEYFGQYLAYEAAYSMLAHFNKPDGSRYEVDQVLQFIVVENAGRWNLLGIVPVETHEMVSTEDTSYDIILSLYR